MGVEILHWQTRFKNLEGEVWKGKPEYDNISYKWYKNHTLGYVRAKTLNF